MNAVRRSLGAAALALLAFSVQAQPRIEPEPSPALSCLKVADGKAPQPVYPFDQYKDKEGGRVKATVTLPGNAVEIQSVEGHAAFEAAARTFLASLSAPCLKSGEKAHLAYDFVFQPDRRAVDWGPPQDAEEPARREMARCVRHLGNAKMPEYPTRARREGTQGRVRALLTFSAPDQPPKVELMHRSSARVFAPAIEDWAEQVRMPCHSGEPVKVGMLFIYRLEGEGRYGFKPLTLTELLRFGKGIKERQLELDTTTMGCPFDLKLVYFSPLRPNRVGEVGASDPRRRPLLELLAGLELDLQPGAIDSIFADTADVAVPCLRLNLNPQEKTS